MILRSGLQKGGKARYKATGQVVNIKHWSQHGLAVVTAISGDDYYVKHKDLIPIMSAN
jgi:hypothetical protein